MIKDSSNFWYSHISALPPSSNSSAYKRLKGIWANKTRFKGQKDSPKRIHELAKIKHETHLTVSIWENFVLFEPSIWIPELLRESGVPLPSAAVKECKWSYEWQKTLPKGIKVIDVTISYETEDCVKHLIVVEAKNMGKKLGEKDRDPMHYLGIEDFNIFGSNKCQIYCLDESIIDEERQTILSCHFPIGILSWQKLASLQFRLALQQFGESTLAGFVCGSMLRQFLHLGIQPPTLPFEYLENETSFKNLSNTNLKQPSSFYTDKLWSLD